MRQPANAHLELGVNPHMADQKDAREQLDQDLAELARTTGGTLHSYPRPGRAVRRVILRDLHTDGGGTQFEAAQLEADGTLRITGHDTGPTVTEFFGADISSYEWVYVVPPDRVAVLLWPLTQLAGRFKLVEGLLKQPARRGEVLEQFDFEIEMDYEGEVLFGPEHLVEEPRTGVAFFPDQPALAAAGVDEKTERQGEIALLREIADGLRAAVLVEQELLFREVADNFALLIAHVGEKTDHLDIGGKRCRVLLLAAQERRYAERGEQAPASESSIHDHL